MLAQPQIATRKCEDCQQWLYDANGQVAQRNGKPVPRPAGLPPPCHTCPKRSPAEARRYELSRKNTRAVIFHYQFQATFGVCLKPRAQTDSMLRKNSALIAEAIRNHERNPSEKSP